MDRTLYAALVRNLLNTDIIYCGADMDGFQRFEEKYCYDPLVQPMFTAGVLEELAGSARDNVFYELRDEFGIWAQLFRFEEDTILVGPYVKQIFDEHQAQRTFAAMHLPAAYVGSFRLYYSAFPVLSSTFVRNVLTACLNSLTGAVWEYSSCRVERGVSRPAAPPREAYSEVLDYRTVYLRYDLENRFLHMIETGDTENVLPAYQNMSLGGTPKNRYAGAVYQNPAIGLSMVRALARKAAERGGAPVVEINEITQRAVQKSMSSGQVTDQTQATLDMLRELTEAVRRHQLDLGRYSAPIRKVVEFLHMNYSQDVKLGFLARLANLSESYLSREFKKEAGMTVFSYLAHLRCVRAADLLLSTDFSIQEISGFVGYLDNNYFVKVFKKEFGITPSDYRRQNRQSVSAEK